MVLTSQGHLGAESPSLILDSSGELNCAHFGSFWGTEWCPQVPLPPPPIALYWRDGRQNHPAHPTLRLSKTVLWASLHPPQLNKGDFNLCSLGLGF